MLRIAGTIADGSPSGSEEQRRRAAWEMLALLAGGTIARGVLDEAMAEEIASAVRDAVGRIAVSEPPVAEAGVGEPA